MVCTLPFLKLTKSYVWGCENWLIAQVCQLISLKNRLMLLFGAECFGMTENIVSVCVSPHYQPPVDTRHCFIKRQCVGYCRVNVT
jgi:hypothetical protein